jgi:hypothetical protein
LPDDHEAALAWIEYRDSLCPGCGRKRIESMAPENDDAYTAIALRCFACAAKERASAEFGRAQHADTAGLAFVIEGPHRTE